MPGFIEQDQWKSFLEEFTKRNQFRATRLEVVGEEVGAQREEFALPLVGVTFEPKGSEAGSVVVILGGESAKDQRQLERHIENVQRIAPVVGEGSVFEEGVGFEDRNGEKTLLIFEQPAELPENTSSAAASRG